MLATGRSWESTRGILRVLSMAPEYVVCSNGAVIMKRVDGAETRYERFHIDTFHPREVLQLLREHLSDAHYMVELPDGARRPMLVGHEPELVEVIRLLCGADVQLPTAALALIELEAPWPLQPSGRGVLRLLVTPKLLATASWSTVPAGT